MINCIRCTTLLLLLGVLSLVGCTARVRTHQTPTSEVVFEDLLITAKEDAPLTCDLIISGWDSWANDFRDDIDGFAEGYLGFLQEVRTEPEIYKEIQQYAQRLGFVAAGYYDTLAASLRAPGTALIFEDACHQNSTLVKMGRRPLAEGCRIYCVDIDLPCMTIKPRPVFAAHQFVLLQTTYLGLMRKHQWLSVPLGLTGTIFCGNDSSKQIALGMDGTGVLVLPDLLPHLADRIQRTTLIKTEDLDVLAGLGASRNDDTVTTAFLQLLQQTVGVSADDFAGARLALIPLIEPLEVGVDRGMVGGYGQRAKLPIYLGLEAIAEIDTPEYTTIVCAVNGLSEYDEFSTYTPILGDLLATLSGYDLGSTEMHTVQENARALAGGTMPAVNPLYKDGWAEQGYGPVLVLAGEHGEGGAALVDLFIGEEMVWQMIETVYDRRTLDYMVEREGVQCFNMVCPLLAEGSFCELVTKMDLFLTYEALRTFLNATEL